MGGLFWNRRGHLCVRASCERLGRLKKQGPEVTFKPPPPILRTAYPPIAASPPKPHSPPGNLLLTRFVA